MQQDANEKIKSTSILARVRLAAERYPESIAVCARDTSLSYAELVARVDELAARLAPLLPERGMLVAVCLERTVDLPAWLLAIFKLGAAYLPIDPMLPAARIAQVIDGANPAFVIASRTLAGRLPANELAVIDADEEGADHHHPVASPPVASPADTMPHDLAYVMYTSGSTGQPKGVEITHGGIVTLIDGMARSPGLSRGETLLALTRLSFDISVADIFLALGVGARLVLLDLNDAADPRRLAAAIALHTPDMMQATPATWRALLEWGWTGCPQMRALCGGEAMTRDLANRLLPCCGELWNIYGPTEATVWATIERVTVGTGPVAIGRPIDGATVMIADDDLTEMPAGEIGEIVIGGPGVARGYRNAPVLTADRFARLDDGMPVYRTGDLGRLDPDGSIYCLGRRDDQVKVRGFRIELGDIESALAAHPHIAWCAARVWQDPTGENVLVGYVVARPGGALPTNDVKTFLADTLPPYMIPTRIVPMVELPMTPNGKVDRNALPSPVDAAPIASTSTYDNDVERGMATIWCELLGVADVARDDDFFDLGGYSLITVRLLRRIEQDFGRILEIADLMRSSTLSAMAALVVDGNLAPSSSTMLLNAGGDRPPLYWLDAGPLIRGMARGAAPEQPIYGLNLTKDDEARLSRDAIDIVSTATTLRGHLMKAQPEGPYYIGGWCRWGVVAHELACQLRDDGQDVALLVLLDATVPTAPSPREILRSGLSQVRNIFHPTESKGPQSFSQRVENALCRHVARIFDGDTLLIRATDAPQSPNDGGWRGKTRGSLEVVRTSGDHETMIRPPHVARLAAVISDHLLTAQRTRADVKYAGAARVGAIGGLAATKYAGPAPVSAWPDLSCARMGGDTAAPA
ncbi:MAG: amino acid adenylation protein [Sphingomonadales bacterium]|nr:amino acid adenylation protein [Sphingomonadales bacterium]